MSFTADDVGPVLRNGEEIVLPLAERQAIADEWNANAAAAPPPTRPVPALTVVRGLHVLGLLDEAEAAMAQQPLVLQKEWEKAVTIDALLPRVINFLAALGTTMEAVEAAAPQFEPPPG